MMVKLRMLSGVRSLPFRPYPDPWPVQPWPLAAVVPIPWAAGPPHPSRGRPNGFGRASAELLIA
jgi:hypothetical protein